MHDLIVAALGKLGESAVDYAFRALADRWFDAEEPAPEPAAALSAAPAAVRSPARRVVAPAKPVPVPADPAQGAIVVMNAFLRALARGNRKTCMRLCEPHWAQRRETVALIDEALSAAPPVRWKFEELYTPTSWRPGRSLPWVLAELPVTHLTDRGEEIVPTVLRAVQNRGVWQIDRLQWAENPEPRFVNSLADLFPEGFPIPIPVRVVIDCPRCSRKLRVPGDKGRLRVTCPGCKNVQWYTP